MSFDVNYYKESMDYPWIDNSYIKVTHHRESATIIEANKEGLLSFADQVKSFANESALEIRYSEFPGDLEEGSVDLEIHKVDCKGRKNPPNYELSFKIDTDIKNGTCAENLSIFLKEITKGADLSLSLFQNACNIFFENTLYDNCKLIKIDPEIIDSLIESGNQLTMNNDFWCSLIHVISEKSLSNKAIGFLFRKRFAVMEMSRKNLSDYWLKKYSEFSLEPLRTLGGRYIHEEDDRNFVDYAMKYAVKSEQLYAYLIECVPNSLKLRKLLFIGIHCKNERIQTLAKERTEIIRIGMSDNVEEIQSAFHVHSKDAGWLLSIAGNPYTPPDILDQLCNTSTETLDKDIQQTARDTIELLALLKTQNPREPETAPIF